MAHIIICFVQLLIQFYILLPIQIIGALCEYMLGFGVISIANQSKETFSSTHYGYSNLNTAVRVHTHPKKTVFPTLPRIVEDEAEYLDNSWLGETYQQTARAQNALIIDELKAALLKYVLSGMNQTNSPANLCDLLQKAGATASEQYEVQRVSDDQFSNQFHDQLRADLNEFESVLEGMFQSLDKCLQYYNSTMQNSLKEVNATLSSNELMKLHEDVKRETIAKFQFGFTSDDNEITTGFLCKIQENIDEQLAIFEKESSVQSDDLSTAEEENLCNERLCNEIGGDKMHKETEYSHLNKRDYVNLLHDNPRIPFVEFNSRSLGNDQAAEKVLKIHSIETLYMKPKGKSGVGEILNKAIKIFAASEALNASIVSGELTGSVEIAKEMLENEFEWSFPNRMRSVENVADDSASMSE